MPIEWTPSPELTRKAIQAYRIYQELHSYRKTAKAIGHSFPYIYNLVKWVREHPEVLNEQS